EVGIYELDGDKLKICLGIPKDSEQAQGLPRAGRPTEFTSAPGTGAYVMILKRRAKPADAPTKELFDASWKQIGTEKVNFVRFEPTRMVQFRDGQLRFIHVVYRNNEILQLNFGGGTELLGKFEVKEGELLFEDPTGKKHKFERLAKAPSELTL